jgi:cobalt transporter subunit CbtA
VSAATEASPPRPLAALLSAALIAGLIAGLLATALQASLVWPLIAQAEVFEDAAPKAPTAGHDHATAAPDETPPLLRSALSMLINVAVAVGYALLMVAAMVLAGLRLDWRSGLLWGLAGWLSVVLAPAIGLPPLPPGVETGPLAARQLWWIATALSTAGGLAAILLTRGRMRLYWAAAGVALIVLPQLIGAPVGPPEGATPAELRRHFAWMVLITTCPPFLASGVLLGGLLAPRRTP